MKIKKYHIIIAACSGILIGIVANRNRSYLINAQFIRNHWHFRDPIKDKLAIFNGEKVMVFLAFGQSNAANYGNGTYTCKHEVYNFYKDNLYVAKEPLLGPDGSGCSVWTRVADRMIDSRIYKKVIIVPIGIGATSISCWTEGNCRKKLDETLNELVKKKIKLTHIFWYQGETDNVDGTSKQEYKNQLKLLVDIFREKKIDAPFYTSITSYFPYNNNHPLGINKNIQEAQEEVTAERDDVLLGPNTDSINLAYYRADAVHFTEKGLDVVASAWVKRILESR